MTIPQWDMRHAHAQTLIAAALTAADPANGLQRTLSTTNTYLNVGDLCYDLANYDNVYLIGYGKAAARMAQVSEAILGDTLTSGLVITKHQHSVPTTKTQILEASHPVPDADSVSASDALLEFVAPFSKRDLVIVLVSGGGSALLTKPADGISLEDLQSVTQALLACGATIHEINAVRKHLSAVKGGQLAAKIAPATCVALVLSDVLGNDLSVIASGPTSPDPSTFADAIGVLQHYGVWQTVPQSVRHRFTRGQAGEIAETPKLSAGFFEHNMEHRIIGDNGLSIDAVQTAAEDLGFDVQVVTRMLDGEARQQAQNLLANAQTASRPLCLIAGGETTVTLRGTGKGGRNQELALAAALALDRLEIARCQVISLATDGTDGPTDAAGAIVDSTTVQTAAVSLRAFLDNNDSYNCFSQIGGLLNIGPTGTNVNDVVMICLY